MIDLEKMGKNRKKGRKRRNCNFIYGSKKKSNRSGLEKRRRRETKKFNA